MIKIQVKGYGLFGKIKSVEMILADNNIKCVNKKYCKMLINNAHQFSQIIVVQNMSDNKDFDKLYNRAFTCEELLEIINANNICLSATYDY